MKTRMIEQGEVHQMAIGNDRVLQVEIAAFLIDHLKALAEKNNCTYQEELIRRIKSTFTHEIALLETCEMIMPQLAQILSRS